MVFFRKRLKTVDPDRLSIHSQGGGSVQTIETLKLVRSYRSTLLSAKKKKKEGVS
jgi:hypothetical protein